MATAKREKASAIEDDAADQAQPASVSEFMLRSEEPHCSFSQGSLAQSLENGQLSLEAQISVWAACMPCRARILGIPQVIWSQAAKIEKLQDEASVQSGEGMSLPRSSFTWAVLMCECSLTGSRDKQAVAGHSC